jgi:anti-sigma factor (TIGR02949 family)
MYMTHDCDALTERLSEYIDGELDPRLCAEIEAHLSACENCRVLVDTTRKTILLYRRQSPAEIPSDVRARLYKALDLEPFLKQEP